MCEKIEYVKTRRKPRALLFNMESTGNAKPLGPTRISWVVS